jgi:hypothetical protein
VRSRASLAGWAICVLTLLVVATTVALVIANRASIHGVDQVNTIEIVLPIGYAILGGLVVSQQPRNALGWIFLAIAFLNALPGTTTQYSRFALMTELRAPFSPWIPWVGYVAATLVYPSGLATLALLLVPNGRLLSPRWRWVAWAGVVMTGFLLATVCLDPIAIQFSGMQPIPNPTGIAGQEG